jgi:radical SAM superfamily enzyme YgiQ (UPF0313 family)
MMAEPTMTVDLVCPKWPAGSLWGQIWFRFPLLALTTLAGLCPEDIRVRIVDENIEPVDLSDLPDLVGITVMTPLASRAYTLADRYRRAGVAVVLGGVHPTMLPEEASQHADAVVRGEAERSWPQLLDDFRNGALQPLYSNQGFPDMAGMPVPRRDLLPQKGYFFRNTLQTTRGCPYNCHFCSVTSFYGRTFRFRPIAEVVRELESLSGRGVFFVDDNIGGDRAYAKELFRAIRPLKLSWFSQASLALARDEELLRLAADSGCKGLFIGFESLSQESLRAMGKTPNRASEFARSIRAIHDHGIGIQGSFILGTDFDDCNVFAETLRFVEANRIEAVLFTILTPFPGTRLYDQLAAAGRILHRDWQQYDMNHVVFQPKRMTPEELQQGFVWLHRKVYSSLSMVRRLFPFRRSGVFFGVQNVGFRQAWKRCIPWLVQEYAQ